MLLNNCSEKNKLYIWGDSQMQYGLNYQILEKELQTSIKSSAYSGAGLYDLLAFVDYVPDSSEVVLNISKPAIFRKKERDYNQTILSFNSLASLLYNNYSIIETLQIVIKNKTPKKMYYSSVNQELFPATDSLNPSEKLDFLSNSLSKIPEYYYDKEALYFIGIKKLLSKGCKINMVVFPFNKLLDDNIENKNIDAIFYQTCEKLYKLAGLNVKDTFEYSNNQNPFYDYTHLNKIGADYFSKLLIPQIKAPNHKFIVLQVK